MASTASPDAAGQPPDARLVMTRRAVAAAFDVTPAAITKWARLGCPALAEAPYDLDAIEAWRTVRARARIQPVATPSQPAAADGQEPAQAALPAGWITDVEAEQARRRKLMSDAERAAHDARKAKDHARRVSIDADRAALQLQAFREGWLPQDRVLELYGGRLRLIAQRMRQLCRAASRRVAGIESAAKVEQLLRDELEAAFADIHAGDLERRVERLAAEEKQRGSLAPKVQQSRERAR